MLRKKKFRSFVILLPKTKIQSEIDPSVLWYESSTMIPLGPPSERPQVGATLKMMVMAALAGGLASSSSTFFMHPVDTLKTRIQSIVGATAKSVAGSIPKLGAKGLYRGVIPATVGAGASHGLRTCAYEGSQVVFKMLLGPGAELQIQGLSSFIGTLLGTCLRIPCEVLKQRLQVGLHGNVGEAVNIAVKTDGWRGLFKGTAATMSREVPFYVLGMVGYEQLKKLVSGELLNPEGTPSKLSVQQTIGIGALSGAIAAILTTPADVMKTRIMTAGVGVNVSAVNILVEILQKEGLLALFKGALPRAIWIAPLGAMNFAGYELAKNALTKSKEQKSGQQIQEESQDKEDVLLDAVILQQNTIPTPTEHNDYMLQQQISQQQQQQQQQQEEKQSTQLQNSNASTENSMSDENNMVRSSTSECENLENNNVINNSNISQEEVRMSSYEKPLGSLLKEWSACNDRWRIPIREL
eukprot:TRINITY_DN1319_c0_g1_i1.p1 TRINITY_DN1319_c0_g1~~TRINITY_DN1319_c0_g1_i1.p1  ORF type:complete len:468 (-),score=93.66 TRINITY_DN1319_c0_g1_i1:178-1581(-)